MGYVDKDNLMTLKNIKSKYFIKLFRVNATKFSWFVLVSLKKDNVATFQYHAKQILYASSPGVADKLKT